MNTGACLAEIKLFAHNVTLYGTVTEMTDQNIQLRLLTLPAMGSMLDPGTEASVLCVSGQAIVSVVASVTDCHDQELMLVPRPTSESERRREGLRIPCDLPAQFRAIRSDSSFGDWMDGQIVDLGKGGLGMVMAAGTDVPSRIEIMFHLPSLTGAGGGTDAAPAGDGAPGMLGNLANGTAIRIAARTEYVRFKEDGQARVGLAYTMVGPADRARLACFLECASHAALC